MSDLRDVCAALEAIDGDILLMARELHGKAQAYRQASQRASSAGRGADGEGATALGRVAAALAAAARNCDLAALALTGASREGQAYVKRTVGAAGGTGAAGAGGAVGSVDGTSHSGAAALAPGGAAHIDYDSLPGKQSESVTAAFEQAIEARWTQDYAARTRGERDIRAFSVGAFTWLWDATPSPGADEPDNRLIGVYGRSDPSDAARDESRIRGFPSPQRDNEQAVHRGHGAAHSIGGADEGFNLFGQSAAVNIGARWRSMEKYCADNPGTFMFMRAIYSDDSDQPSGLEYGVVQSDGTIHVEYFDNL